MLKSYSDKVELLAEKKLYGPLAWIVQPSYWALRIYRFGRAGFGQRSAEAVVRHAVYFVLYSIVRLLTGIDIPRSVQVGPRLMIHHFGGIIVHPKARIGADCVLRHGVTIGELRMGGGVPIIGNRVVFGAYSQCYGEIQIGDDATLGAMAVVIHTVERGSTVVGNPARIVRTS